MKRFGWMSLLVGFALLSPAAGRAQNNLSPAAIAAGLQELDEERRRINSEITATQETNARLERRIIKLEGDLERLSGENRQLRETSSRQGGTYATQEQLRELAESLKGTEKRRLEGDQAILKEIKELLQKELAEMDRTRAHASVVPAVPTPTPTIEKPTSRSPIEPRKNNEPVASAESYTGEYYEHIVETNQTLAKIISAYNRENGLKVTTADVLKANPRLKSPQRLFVGQKLRIPAIKK